LGVPFSDPIADGPVIQEASQRALAVGTSVADVLSVAERVREKSDVPLIVFSYLNPLMAYGEERFAKDAKRAGVNAVLVTDLPPESAGSFRKRLAKKGIGMVFLLAPTSSPERVKLVDKMSDGFVYYVSTTGVTGARKDLEENLLETLDSVRGRLTSPIAVGFGVSRNEHYRALATKCEAVVVGSAIVRAIADGEVAGAPDRAAAVVTSILRDPNYARFQAV
jgi:tryptophan synthase alpha chain